MTSAAADFKGALAVAICLILIHSSIGQQPAPAPAPAPTMSPSDCIPYCASIICGPMCQARSAAEAKKCNDMYGPEVVYAGCFEGCTRNCNGNSAYARGSCNLGSCSARSCGCPCARSCCKSCTSSAIYSYAYAMCMSSQEKVFGHCMPPCMTGCNNKCVNGSAPYTP